MPQNQAFDSLELDSLDLPFDLVTNPLDPTPRLVLGENMYITPGGALSKRPGLIKTFLEAFSNLRCDRLWVVETNQTPQKVFLVGSFYDTLTSLWRIKYIRLTFPVVGTWTDVPNYRDINQSTRPHTGVVARGILFLKGFPGTSEKLGSVVFDGHGASPVLKPWGLLGPTIPAKVDFAYNTLAAPISESATTITTKYAHPNQNFPAPPFEISINQERMNVTAVSGTTWTVTRGLGGADTIRAHGAGSKIYNHLGGPASTNQFQVNFGWRYAYAWRTTSGHVSNRSPEQENSDAIPNFTGLVRNRCPRVIVRGHPDTANVEKIVIYRTTDGGGTYYFLEEINNPGDVDVTYTDSSYETGIGGGTFSDPVPDVFLNQAAFSPSITSNSPPPANIAPKITGVDPVDFSPVMEFYAGRIWFPVGNVLFFSSQEELRAGVPEEAFPSGLRGNFFRFQQPITGLAATKDSMVVTTETATYILTGENRETFNINLVFEQVGHPLAHPLAMCKFEEHVAMLTNDYRIILFAPTSASRTFRTISLPLDVLLTTAISEGAEVMLSYLSDYNKRWLIVSANNYDNPAKSVHFIYDLDKTERTKRGDIWFCPWRIPSSLALPVRLSETRSQRQLLFYTFDPVTGRGGFSRLDSVATKFSDDLFGELYNLPYTCSFTTSLMPVPPGNHVNALRAPGLTPNIYQLSVNKNSITPDLYTSMQFFVDDLWTSPDSPVVEETPARRDQSKGYVTRVWPINKAGQRVAIGMKNYRSTDPFIIYSLAVTFAPESGA